MKEKKRILVIDDDPDVHEYCRMVLEAAGYAVDVANSGTEGKTAANSAPPDLVVLDVMMEQADTGFETAKWFAANHPEMPVLMLSSIADAADSLFDTSTLSVAELVNKPIAPDDLLAMVARLLARSMKG